ncbi:MAG: hypothetical protein ACFWT0_02135 [Bifidobacterium crudilactis]|jgi:ferrous iron transport protein A
MVSRHTVMSLPSVTSVIQESSRPILAKVEQHSLQSAVNSTTVGCMTQSLRTCPLGMEIEICAIELSERYRFRLNELGFREHERLTVIQKANFGGCVVSHGSERIAVDGATARRILVKPS